MSSLCIKNASVIVTCDDQDSVLENSSILIEDGVIRSIGQQTFSADEILDASGCMVYPGLINTHHHLYQTFSRNLPQVQNMELFEWLTTLYEIWKNLDSSIIYHSSVTGMGELLKTGCTTCFDHHYVFPGGSSVSLLEAQFEAARQLEQEGVSAAVIDMFTLKPIDRMLVKNYAEKTGRIVTCENHSIHNGLGSAVAEVLVEICPVPMRRVGVKERYGQVGTQDFLQKEYGLTAHDIVSAARELL